MRDLADVAVAIMELALARAWMLRVDPLRIASLAADRSDEPGRGGPGHSEDIRRIERVGRAIARAERRVPWRSDCLVQALAARHWLSRHKVDSRLHIGVRRGPGFEAHAWLEAGGLAVTGGDGVPYAELAAIGEGR